MSNIQTAAEALGGLRLPPDLEPLEVAGEGSQCIVFKAVYRGDMVAMKVYRPEAIERFRKKHKKNIAVYEMSRNRSFRKVPELLPFTAKPLTVMGHDGKCTLMFLQEFVEGITVEELARSNRGLPASVLEAGENIVRTAEMHELYMLELAVDNAMVRNQNGVWTPVLYDFNQPPVEEKTSGSIFSRAFGGGKNKLALQDYKSLADWRNCSEQFSN
jgi:hypothetical protein